MKVFLLQSEHQVVPGRITKIFASRALADVEAADCVNLMLDFADLPKSATPQTWQEHLADLLGQLDLEDDDVDAPYVDIEEHEVVQS